MWSPCDLCLFNKNLMKIFCISSSLKDVTYYLREQLFVSAHFGSQVYTIEYFKDGSLAHPVRYNFLLSHGKC